MRPWLFVDFPAGKDQTLRLCDFATAGVGGNQAVSWLPGRELLPPPPVPSGPIDGASVPAGAILFRCRRPLAVDPDRRLCVTVAETPDWARPVLQYQTGARARLVVPAAQAKALRPGVDYFWKLTARNAHGAVDSLPPAQSLSH